MKARLLKKWGTNYAGQILTNVQDGSIPSDVAEFFEDDDPAVNTVVAQTQGGDPLSVVNDEINPETAATHDEAQRAAAAESREVAGPGAQAALQQLEVEQTQERARDADNFAAGRDQAAADKLTAGQREKNAAGKSHGHGENKASSKSSAKGSAKASTKSGKGK